MRQILSGFGILSSGGKPLGSVEFAITLHQTAASRWGDGQLVATPGILMQAFTARDLTIDWQGKVLHVTVTEFSSAGPAHIALTREP